MKDIYGETQILTYWHHAVIINLPAGSSTTLTYRPRDRNHYYIVFSLAMGTPRDYDTGAALITDDYGFWHRHSQVRWHWNPGLESVYNFEEPEFFKLTYEDPMELEFINNSTLRIIHDINIHIYEVSASRWPLVRDYLKGIHKFYMFWNILDKISPGTLEQFILKVIERTLREPLPPPPPPEERPPPEVPPAPPVIPEEEEGDPPTRWPAY